MYHKKLNFEDVQEHAASLEFWEQYYDQLSPGPFQGLIEDLRLPGIRVFRESMSTRVAQHTQPPPATTNVLIPIRLIETDGMPANSTIAADCLSVLPRRGEFYFCTPADTEYFILSIEDAWLEAILGDNDLAHFRTHPRGFAVRPPAAVLECLRRYTGLVLDEGRDRAGSPEDSNRSWVETEAITNFLLQCLEREPNPGRQLTSYHWALVHKAHERALESDQSVGVLSLCHEFKVSRRTLHEAFVRVTGVPPSRYLRAVRLNAADRDIRVGAHESVTELAFRWGFSHASHFGREYKKLYGLPPSQTGRHRG